MSSATSDLDRVAAVVLQLMRGPILVLLCVYAIGITGMTLMPGQDADGNPSHMNLFHSFYFFTYSATTTGFGEIPHAFTDQQRRDFLGDFYRLIVCHQFHHSAGFAPGIAAGHRRATFRPKRKGDLRTLFYPLWFR